LILILSPSRVHLRLFFLYCSHHHRDLHSFPTRRSSDLVAARPAKGCPARPPRRHRREDRAAAKRHRTQAARRPRRDPDRFRLLRSEEHTSELQSRENLVCRLLLEKKKKKNYIHEFMRLS